MPIDPSRLNAVGDLVVTEVDELLALADPVRLDLFDLVRREGPLATEDACSRLGLSADTASSQLRRPKAQRAARALNNTMLVKYASLPTDWVRQTEPSLDVTWARSAGLFNARTELAPDELRRLQDDLERLLEPFLTRPADNRPPDAAPVRITAYFLPEPG